MLDRLQNDSDVFRYDVIEIIPYPQHNPRTYNNDIALLKLNTDVKFSEFIFPICLPTKQHDELKVTITEFGRTGDDHVKSEKLLKDELEKFSHEECQEQIPTKEIDRATMLCFGSHFGKKDACRVS